MRGFLLRAIICGLGLWVADRILPGLGFTTLGGLIFAAVLLGIVNAIIRPVLLFLTLPLTVITLGLFVFVVNGLMVALVAKLLPGMKVAGLWDSILTAIIVGIVGWLTSWLIGGEGRVKPVKGD